MFVDADGDGHGDPASVVVRCPEEAFVSEVPDDCDDTDARVHPLHPEVCDGVDNQCDGRVDLDDPALVDVPQVYLDLDGDGYGVSEHVAITCPSARWALASGDCDDADASVHPGAPEGCDGRDTDCDGQLPSAEADGDGDGDPACSDCDDADPRRASTLAERCSGVDDDCDGLLDDADDSVNPYSCGVCPPADAGALAATPMHWEAHDPCELDRAARLLCDPDRTHRVGWRTDEGAWRDELLVYLPPAHGRDNDTLRAWAAYAGYRVIGLVYASGDLIADACAVHPDPVGCRTTGRDAVLFGGTLADEIAIPKADSIDGRLQTLLVHLVATHPAMGFDAFLDEADQVRWDRVVIMGWSTGGGQAAYVAQVEPTVGAVLLSSPKDASSDLPQPWMSLGATDPSRIYGSFHRSEAHLSSMRSAFTAMGVDKEVWDVDRDGPAPLGIHRLGQSVDPASVHPDCTPHSASGNDQCLRPRLLQPYLRMLCGASATGG